MTSGSALAGRLLDVSPARPCWPWADVYRCARLVVRLSKASRGLRSTHLGNYPALLANAAGLQGYQLANGAEIMRTSGWAAADLTRFQEMMLEVSMHSYQLWGDPTRYLTHRSGLINAVVVADAGAEADATFTEVPAAPGY